MKTDLAKTLSVRGQRGLFNYIAQSRNGAIAESLKDHKRTNFAANSGITTLADISIYTSEGEMKLREVFLALKDAIAEGESYSSKSSESDLQALFAKAVPEYDSLRFHVSHMKKVIDWYNELVEHASLDFEDEESAPEAADE